MNNAQSARGGWIWTMPAYKAVGTGLLKHRFAGASGYLAAGFRVYCALRQRRPPAQPCRARTVVFKQSRITVTDHRDYPVIVLPSERHYL